MTKKLFNYASWAFLALIILYFFKRNVLPYIFGGYNADNYGEDYFPKFAPTILFHLIPGFLALVLGPFQFITSIRNNYPNFHRTSGKIYMISVIIAAFVSFNLSINLIMLSPEKMNIRLAYYGLQHLSGVKFYTYGTGLALLGLAWLLTLAIAFTAIKKGKISLHQDWMRRNYIVTMGFLFYRIGYLIFYNELHIDYYEVINIMSWACWSVPLLVNEVIQGFIKVNRKEAFNAD